MFGFKYDSHVVQTIQSANDVSEKEDTTALYAGFSTFWEHKFNETVGLRTGYNVYGDNHNEFSENDILDQLASIEPHLSFGDFIFSLPLQYTYAREDGEKNYKRYGVMPSVTWSIPNSKQAVEVYGTFSQIKDIDQYPSFDEDSSSWGGGLAYLISIKNRTYFRIVGDYSQTDYKDAKQWDYLGETEDDKRSDTSASLGLEFNAQIKSYVDFVIRYTYVHAESNVRLYDYDKHLIQQGFSFKLF